VKSGLDTGASVSKALEKEKSTHRSKKDEFFKRIKGSQLVELIEDEDVEEETIYGLVAQKEEAEVGPTVVHDGAAQDMDESLFLLLDLREEADYEQCHIATALSYPYVQLTHSTNYFSSEIFRYKNRPDRMIIIYDDEERIAAPAGKLFVERGVENVYVLTGGLRKFLDKFEELVRGVPPAYEGEPPATSRGGTAASRPPMTGRSGASVSTTATASTQRSHGAPSLSMR